MIVVDTSVWSAALRRPKGRELPRAGKVLRELIVTGEHVVLLGVVYQELLSGIRHEAQFRRLARTLEPFPMVLATVADHLEAARVMNVSRANGVQAASMDALIAAMALERGALLLTSDKDYLHIAENTPLDVRYVPSSD